jgi:hypothetical protein
MAYRTRPLSYRYRWATTPMSFPKSHGTRFRYAPVQSLPSPRRSIKEPHGLVTSKWFLPQTWTGVRHDGNPSSAVGANVFLQATSHCCISQAGLVGRAPFSRILGHGLGRVEEQESGEMKDGLRGGARNYILMHSCGSMGAPGGVFT